MFLKDDYNHFCINGESEGDHFTLWLNDIKSSWVNELGLNFKDYSGFGEEMFIKFLIDLNKKIIGKKITINYVINKEKFKNIKSLRVA